VRREGRKLKKGRKRRRDGERKIIIWVIIRARVW
jgi:hypothetical protein